MVRFALVASLVLAATPLACTRTSADRVPSASMPDAAPPEIPSLPRTRTDILSSYVDASTLAALSAALGRIGLSVCSQDFAMGTPAGSPPPASDPDRARYLSECEQLPPAVQRCLGVLYASAHPAECQGVIDCLDAGTRAAVGRLQEMRPTTR